MYVEVKHTKQSRPNTILVNFKQGSETVSSQTCCGSPKLGWWGGGGADRGSLHTHTAWFNILIKLTAQRIIRPSFNSLTAMNQTYTFEWQKLINMVTADWVIQLCTWSPAYAFTHCVTLWIASTSELHYATQTLLQLHRQLEILSK